MAQLQRNAELSLLHLLYFRPADARCNALDAVSAVGSPESVICSSGCTFRSPYRQN